MLANVKLEIRENYITYRQILLDELILTKLKWSWQCWHSCIVDSLWKTLVKVNDLVRTAVGVSVKGFKRLDCVNMFCWLWELSCIHFSFFRSITCAHFTSTNKNGFETEFVHLKITVLITKPELLISNLLEYLINCVCNLKAINYESVIEYQSATLQTPTPPQKLKLKGFILSEDANMAATCYTRT